MTTIDLMRPVGSKKVRTGFQPHWRTVFVYRCDKCNETVHVYANAFSGTRPVPGVGAVTCPHCDK